MLTMTLGTKGSSVCGRVVHARMYHFKTRYRRFCRRSTDIPDHANVKPAVSKLAAFPDVVRKESLELEGAVDDAPSNGEDPEDAAVPGSPSATKEDSETTAVPSSPAADDDRMEVAEERLPEPAAPMTAIAAKDLDNVVDSSLVPAAAAVVTPPKQASVAANEKPVKSSREMAQKTVHFGEAASSGNGAVAEAVPAVSGGGGPKPKRVRVLSVVIPGGQVVAVPVTFFANLYQYDSPKKS
jgi:hypothetical protein